MTRYFYLDTSVALHILFGQSPAAAKWFEEATGDDDAVVFSPRLLRTEITRVLRREDVAVSVRDELLDYMETLPLDGAVLTEADAIVPHVKALDAIHLASVIRSGLDATVVTHDATMRRVAEEIGYATLDPVSGSG